MYEDNPIEQGKWRRKKAEKEHKKEEKRERKKNDESKAKKKQLSKKEKWGEHHTTIYKLDMSKTIQIYDTITYFR